jgi:hypothetical protein
MFEIIDDLGSVENDLTSVELLHAFLAKRTLKDSTEMGVGVFISILKRRRFAHCLGCLASFSDASN